MNPSAHASPTRSAAKPNLHLACSEVWGGNRPIATPVELPGLRGVLYSRPCQGGRGGDVHYLSVCGSGVLSRACLADVVGHGETVAAVSSEMHAHLRRAMNQPDQRRVLAQLNRRLEKLGILAMTTAAAITYYTPGRILSVSYAGHPPGWYYSVKTGTWTRLLPEARPRDGFVDAPLAIDPSATYTRRKFRAALGDRIVLVTDGVLEAPSPDGDLFGEARLERVLVEHGGGTCDELRSAILAALADHMKTHEMGHDDVTLLVVDIVAGPSEPTFWLAIRNRLIRQRGNGDDAAFSPEVQAATV